MNAMLGISTILLLGLFSGKFTEKAKTPAITAYLILRILIGPYMFGFVPKSVINSAGLISNLALSFFGV